MPAAPHVSLILSAAIAPLIAICTIMAHYWAYDLGFYAAVTERAKVIAGSTIHKCSVVVCISALIHWSVKLRNCIAPDDLIEHEDELYSIG